MALGGFTQPRRSLPYGFVFSWRHHEAAAAALAHRLRDLMPVRVINSEEAAAQAHPDWIHLGERAYFSAQWNELLRQCRELPPGALVLHIQADADPENLSALVSRASALFERYSVGVYEPFVDHTYFVYDRTRLAPVCSDVYEIPCPDCTCWMIARDVLADCQTVDVATNVYGWGICRVVAAMATLRGLRCVRDYGVTVNHPKGRGYDSREAISQMMTWLSTLPRPLLAEVKRLAANQARVQVGEKSM